MSYKIVPTKMTDQSRPKGWVCVTTENGKRRAERLEFIKEVIDSGSGVEILIQSSPESATIMIELDMTFDEVMAEIARAQQ